MWHHQKLYFRVQSIACGKAVAEWLSSVIGRSCHLFRQNPGYKRTAKKGLHGVEEQRSLLSLANESQYLLLTLGSLEGLLCGLREQEEQWVGLTVEDLAERFRANLLVGMAGGGGAEMEPYMEEKWTSVRIGDLSFQV